MLVLLGSNNFWFPVEVVKIANSNFGVGANKCFARLTATGYDDKTAEFTNNLQWFEIGMNDLKMTFTEICFSKWK